MKKIKVGLLVGEFFSNSMPFCNGKGGYGMIARNYITEYIPNDEIEIDTIIGYNDKNEMLIHTVDGRKKIIFLPKNHSFLHRVFRRLFNIDKQISKIVDQYDVFLSIEFQGIAAEVLRLATKNQKLILWIQDPRTSEDWKEIDTMSSYKQTGYKKVKRIQTLLNRLYMQKRLIGISQGKFLIKKAKELYNLPNQFDAKFVPNPIVINTISNTAILEKKNHVVSLGRLDTVKRPWIIGEVAKKLPNYDFYFLGQYHEDITKKIMYPYTQLKNCHFLGHIEGNKKKNILSEAKILINTSIHEAVPVSFLEALSYGLLLVSNRNPDDLTSKFGIYTGQTNGDGYDSIEPFVNGIRHIMENDGERIGIAKQGIEYVKTYHSIDDFVDNLRNEIIGAM